MSPTGVDVTTAFDEPFFTGGEVEADNLGLPVSVNGRGFQIDTASEEFLRKSIKLLNTQQAQTGQDYAIEPPTVWRRSTETWHSGADQSRYDRVDSIDSRYHRSIGIDPWKKFGVELLPDTTQLRALAPGVTALLVTIGSQVFVGTGSSVILYTTLEDGAPTTHACASPIIAMTSDGENLYALSDNGAIAKRTAAGVWSTWFTQAGLVPAKAMLAYVKGFILLGNGPFLYTVAQPAGGGAAVSTLVYQHLLPDWWWRAAAEGLSVIHLLGGMGDRWHIHSVTIAKTGATLDPPIVAATLPDGEVGYSLATYLGYVLIGTSNGWRFGMPDSSGALTYGQLIATPAPVLCFEGQGRFVWFGLSLASAITSDEPMMYAEQAGLGRADLSVFVAPMTPAAATDLAAPGFGVVRSAVTAGSTLVGLGRRVFSVDGLGVYYQAANLVPSGWLEQGVFTFNSTDQKMGLYAQVFTEPLVGEVEVAVSVDTDHLTWTLLGRTTIEDSVTLGNMPYTEAFNAIEMRYKLFRSTTAPTLGPRLVRSEFRAIDIPGRATEWHVPLLLFEDQTWDNAVQGRNVISDYDFLMALVRSRQQFIYREGTQTWNLHASDFVWKPDHLTSDRVTYQGTFLLIAREIT